MDKHTYGQYDTEHTFQRMFRHWKTDLVAWRFQYIQSMADELWCRLLPPGPEQCSQNIVITPFTTITTTTTRHINLNFIFIKWQKALTNSNFKMRYRCRAHWVCIYLFQISRSVNLLITVFSEKKFWITYLLSVFIGQRFMVCANKIKTHSGYY